MDYLRQERAKKIMIKRCIKFALSTIQRVRYGAGVVTHAQAPPRRFEVPSLARDQTDSHKRNKYFFIPSQIN
ncbi:hypothetical protein EVAR_78287_1 [Eumeta japonica]|uniref:Uncharacterized protein n=1 Tax=Eumeta variegata TaxID=151549 RepID=A0A4C1T635_EUMVA|nr:hypothetical protein EVAR_78287_1 [Eumeta japonica]